MIPNSRFNLLKYFFWDEEKKEKDEDREMEELEYNKKQKEIESVSKKRGIDIPKTLRSEFHFLKFPFFDLSPRMSKKDRIEIQETEETKEGKIEILWRVARNIDSDFPSSFARRLHKEIVEKIINSIKKPIPRLIELGSLREICKNIGIAASGKNFNNIKKALRDTKATTINVKGTFRKKEKNGIKKFFEGTFNLYDMIFFTGETLPDGKEADAVYVLLNDMYVQNFNNNFVVPIDYPYFLSLEGDIASRMYEIFNVWFYPSLENGKNFIEKEYSEICDYFPITRQNVKWKAKGQLKKAHNQHILNGFLASEPEWLNIGGKKDDWVIRYRMGHRAINWYQLNNKNRFFDQNKKQIKSIQQSEGQEEVIKNLKKRDEDKKNDSVAQLIDLGITKKVAKDLIKNKNPEIIEGWTKAVYDTNAKDKAAFVVKAIEENWQLPEIYKKKKKEQNQLQQKAKTKKQKKLAEQQTAYREYLKNKIEQYKISISQDQYQAELEELKQHLFEKYPWIKTQHWEGPVIKSTAEANYKDWLIEQNKIKISSFEEWQKERETGSAIAVK